MFLAFSNDGQRASKHFDISQLVSLQPAWLKQMWSPVDVRLHRLSESEWLHILECLDLRSLASSFSASPVVSNAIPAEEKLSLFAKELLATEFDADKLCAHLGVEVNKRRLRRLVGIATEAGDTLMMNASAFRKVVQVQLALEHMRKSRHNLTGAEVIEVLLGSISQRLVVGTMWAAVLNELQKERAGMDLQEDFLGVDVSLEITYMERVWRQQPIDFVCIETLFTTLAIAHGRRAMELRMGACRQQ